MITGNAVTQVVHVGGVYLDASHSQLLVNHSPDGFGWGYAGSGPSQLALALLLFFTHAEQWSIDNHQQFKFDIVMKWPPSVNLNIPNKAVTDWIKKHGGRVS